MIFVLYIVIVVVINAALLGLGLDIGAILHWLIPAIDLGIGTLTGMISLLVSFYLLSKINSLVVESERDEVLNSVDSLGRTTYVIDQLPPLPRRKRKPRAPKA